MSENLGNKLKACFAYIYSYTDLMMNLISEKSTGFNLNLV